MPLEKVWRVLGVVHSLLRAKNAAWENCAQQPAFRHTSFDVACVASAFCIAACRRVGLLVTLDAALHARQLLARGKLDFGDIAVALPAADVARRVFLVAEKEIGRRDVKLGNAEVVTALGAQIAKVAKLAVSQVVMLLDVIEIHVARAVAWVARGGTGRENVFGSLARERFGVARFAFKLLGFHVKLVIHTNRDVLRWENDSAWTAIARSSSWRKPRFQGIRGACRLVGRRRRWAVAPLCKCRGLHERRKRRDNDSEKEPSIHFVTARLSQSMTRNRCPEMRLLSCSNSASTKDFGISL